MNKILFIEDLKTLQMLYSDELVEEGYEVIFNEDSNGILKIIEKEKPDLVIIDCVMGHKNCCNLIRKLRISRCAIPVIVFSSKQGSEKEVFSAGDYMVMGSSISEMKMKARRLLSSSGGTGGEQLNQKNFSECKVLKMIDNALVMIQT